MLGPRNDCLCWDDTWMAIAQIAAQRSKDPNTQVGSCIVDKDNHIVGLGYNGFPRGCCNYSLPWDREGDPLKTKYLYVAHAEGNTIDNSDRNRIIGGTIYTTLYPCNACAIRIIQNGIKEVVYLSDKYHDSNEATAARLMFVMAGVKVRQFKCKCSVLVVNLQEK